jgi:hypothetical protein
MRRFVITLVAIWFVAAISVTFIRQVGAQPPGGPPGGGGRPPMGMMGMPVDSFASERDSLMKDALAYYAGKETMPAESVFKNLKVIKGRTVQDVLRMMNFGFGRSLGVRCQHCHVLGHYADEDKNTKQIARDMMAMTSRINDELLPAIKNIKSDHPGVNCGTCHHGTARPGFGPMGMGGPPGGPPGGHR